MMLTIDIPAEALVATGIFARAKAKVGVRLPMYVEREAGGLFVHFEGLIGSREYHFGFLMDGFALRADPNPMVAIEAEMWRHYGEFLRQVDVMAIDCWLDVMPAAKVKLR